MKITNYSTCDLKIKRERIGISILRILTVLITSLLLFSENMTAQEIDFSRAKGEMITRGTNETLVEGEGFMVKSYRIEKLPLPQSFELTSEDKKQKTSKVVAIRLVITGEFPSGNYAIWINGVPSPAYIGVDGNLQINRIGYEKMFEENSEIAISSGGIESKKILLPEPFRIPPSLERPARSKEELKRNVDLKYIGCDGSIFATEKDCVEVYIYKNPYDEFRQQVYNHGWYLQIGSREFIGGPSRFIVSRKDFAQLKDGEWVVVKTAPGIAGGAMVGILDKSSIDKR
jgi:hypothetical protein